MNGFRIASCTANYGHADLFQVFDRLAELRYDGAEVTVMYHAVPADTSAARRAEIRQRAKDAGLSICGLHFIFPGGLSMVGETPADRARVGEYVGTVLDLAADLDAAVVTVGGGGLRTAPSSVARDLAVERVVEAFGQIARHAERAGVMACFEALNRFEAQIGRTLAECSRYVDQIGSPNLKVAGDIFHMNIEEVSIPQAIEAAGDHLAHIHIPDSNRLAPGRAHVDFSAVLKSLRNIGYHGFLSAEIFWIAPDIPYLDSFEACDREVVQTIRHMREMEKTL